MLTCDRCQKDIPEGEAFTLDGSTYDAACAWENATYFLSDYLHPAFTPVELTEKRYAEAWRVVEALRPRVLMRMAEVASVRMVWEAGTDDGRVFTSEDPVGRRSS